MRGLVWVVAVGLVAGLAGCKGRSEGPPQGGPVPATRPGAPSAEPAAPGDAALVWDAVEAQVAAPAPARRLWIDRLGDLAAFDAYATEQGGERFTKFVIDLHTDAVYYFDVDVYKVHKDFVFQELLKQPRTKAAVRKFDRNYSANKVDFMMCYLVHHTSQDVWTFAFWDGDRATARHVTHAYERLKATFFLGDQVKFRPDSSFQEKVARKLVGVPFVLNDQLYRAAEYQAFNQGTAVGKLRIVPPNVAATELTFGTDEIVVLTTPLADITPVAGIISEQFSTPLSHVSLRARAWGIPNIGLRGARVKHGDLDGKSVWFGAHGGTYTLREATAAELAAHQAKVHAKVVVPAADLTIRTLATLDALRAKDVVVYGAKTVNLGELVHARVPGVEVPPGFGVPFAYYAAHLTMHGIDQQLATALAEPAFSRNAPHRRRQLAALKQAIIAAPVSDELRAAVTTALAELPGAGGGVFVRSSGNAEDLEDFNGAGLYDTVPNVHGVDAVLEAIKQVWGSTFNFAAFEDRTRAGIPPARVVSGVLVQVGVPATAAGVLVTRHPTDPTDQKNYTINAKSGLGMSVVDGKKLPESLIVSWYNRGIRILSRSAEDTKLVFDERGGIREVPNPNPGKPVLTNDMALRLAAAAKQITKVFGNDRLDIEWLFVGDRLYIVQTRPLVGGR